MADESFESRVKLPEAGQVVRVRTRTHLVEGVERNGGYGTVVRLACLDDDAQGQPLEVIWELELDGQILDSEAWQSIGKKGFDPPRYFSAYIHTLHWNCVTATDPKLFQSPFRAGIKVDAYQLEPLRKALLLPRVNLFIADDVGLGKTIEAGLIASELLLRRRVKEVVVACPPSMIQQWKDEMEARFGLTFETLDRAYLERIRQERGYGVNPWATFPRFIVSHRLLIDESYTSPLLDWLDNLRPGSLLIFDEAHHAAPSSGGKYAIDSRITKAIREIARRFEHRLFLSATPHNGHSNSFSALLELLDDQRFIRGVEVDKQNLDKVMVRRMKEDIRQIVGGFAERKVVQVDLKDLPSDTPELKLSKLLDQYRQVRQLRVSGATKRKQAEAALLVSHLQQRLLSSVEAFARTLAVHRRTMERIWAGDLATARQDESFTRFESAGPDIDGELAFEVERAPLAIDLSWLPAIENHGEGIFLLFNADLIKAWLEKPSVIARGLRLAAGFEKWKQERESNSDFPGLPYYLLHSLSHLLLTAISLDCGYPASSLRERVYASRDHYGLLIYTGSSDSEGTLGGLVEAGRGVKRYMQLALEHSMLCSNDPICAHHAPSGPDHEPLLGSACHGCLLVAETSCEQHNAFLDRSLVVQTIESLGSEFFETVV